MTRTWIVAVLVVVAPPCAAQSSPPEIGVNTRFSQEVAAQTEAAHASWNEGYDPTVMDGIFGRSYRACLITEEAFKVVP